LKDDLQYAIVLVISTIRFMVKTLHIPLRTNGNPLLARLSLRQSV